jgi:hypothetical protein
MEERQDFGVHGTRQRLQKIAVLQNCEQFRPRYPFLEQLLQLIQDVVGGEAAGLVGTQYLGE